MRLYFSCDCPEKLREDGLYKHTTHCTIKHLNNFIEQDHRHVKRRFLNIMSLASTSLCFFQTLQQNQNLHQNLP
ncbi:DDE-type integrase/transposase/recombinase [Bacillus toyonensis]|nr:DDE-type integrase/transposase/recombinase [Bacillus toyonensis]